MTNPFKPGDLADHKSGTLDPRPVESVEGDTIRLNILGLVSEPVLAANYYRIAPEAPPDEKVTVMWCGERREATVVKRFKNGKVRVQIGRARWTGGRPGSATDAPRVTVEPWQIVPEEKD